MISHDIVNFSFFIKHQALQHTKLLLKLFRKFYVYLHTTDWIQADNFKELEEVHVVIVFIAVSNDTSGVLPYFRPQLSRADF